ncbi:MAG: A/G-specific adenine glycosylase [Armatimonadetes bacterium]|nr:A/G-specific adenine glycosylase [Armatimonadota bacterium]
MAFPPEAQAALLAWYDANKRNLPWRRTLDPYAIWVSEAMCQQTSVAVATPYWERWMARFPDVSSLAAADEHDVLSLWQGLGYYRRAKSLLAGAQTVMASGMPDSASGWLKVPGVGPYTASAIASIANNEPVAVVDGNVERVYARVTDDSAAGATLKRNAGAWAQASLLAERPGDWNQAVMELGALVCTPRSPDCRSCPVREWCLARSRGTAENLPTKQPKPTQAELFWTCTLANCEGKWAVEQIKDGKWWVGMWRFPTLEEQIVPEGVDLGTITHTVTKHKVTMRVVKRELSAQSELWTWVSAEQLELLPLPSLYRKAWDMARRPVLLEVLAERSTRG